MLTHHAYYIEGPIGDFDAYQLVLKPLYGEKYERFGIDEARKLTEFASLRNLTDTVFLLAAASITSEAQQALLKLFEEPQPGTIFVLMLPYGTLLPTLRSRMLVYPDRLESKEIIRVAKFLKADGKTRTAEIATLLKDEDDQKERVRDFLNGLEVQLSKDISKPEARVGLEDIAKVRSYVGDRSPSLKMLLEHLAMSLPKT